MFSLVTLFSLMMIPAIAALAVSFVIGVFEEKSNSLTVCGEQSLKEVVMS